MANPTIKEAKANKIKLESDILKLINDFEKTNGIFISYINVQRKRDKDTYPEEAISPTKKGPVENVEINMDLDLIY